MPRTLLQTYQILADPNTPHPPTPSNDSKMDFQNQTLHQPFDSSMGLTFLVLLTALFFMGFFSVYIRRFSHDSPVELSRRRTPLPDHVTASRARACGARGKGLDFEAIQSIPVVKYSVLGFVMDWDCCAVCLAEFEEGEGVKTLPFCKHVFHCECIDTWLAARASCPVCRTSRIFEEEEKVVVVVEGRGDGGVRRCCSCSELGVVVEGSEEEVVGRGGLERTRSL